MTQKTSKKGASERIAGLGGKKWRAIDFREGEKIDEAALEALLREAVAYNSKHSVPKSKGSRA